MAFVNPERPNDIIHLFFIQNWIEVIFQWLTITINYLNDEKVNFKLISLKLLIIISLFSATIIFVSGEIFRIIADPELIFNGVLILIISNLFILYKKNSVDGGINFNSNILNLFYLKIVISNLILILWIISINSQSFTVLNFKGLPILLIIKAIVDITFQLIHDINFNKNKISYNF